MRNEVWANAVFISVIFIFQIASSNGTECGERISLQGDSHGIVETRLQNYRGSCEIQLTAPLGKRIQLNFIKIFNTMHDAQTVANFLDGNKTKSYYSGLYRSWASPYPFSYLSVSNQLLFTLSDVNSGTRKWAFKCEFRVTDGCNMVFRQSEGGFTIPSNLDQLEGEEQCTYKVEASVGMKISLIFPVFQMGHCREQNVTIYEGTGASKYLSHVRCQSNVTQFLSKTNSVTLVLRSKKSAAKSLQVLYMAGEEGCNKVFTDASGLISSPFYPWILSTNIDCRYQIRAGTGKQIFLKHARSYNTFSRHYAQVYEGEFHAGKSAVPYPFNYYDHGRWQVPKYVSASSNLTIRFMTSSNPDAYVNQFYYSTTVGCNFDFSFDVGYVGSPMFPLNYPNNLSCNYTLTVQHGHRLYFWTDRFSVEYSHNCKADNLSLYDGTGQLLSSWCGTQRRIIYSVTNKMFAVFKSNAHGTSVGIMARHAFQWSGTSPCISYDIINDWDGYASQCHNKLVNGWYRFKGSSGGLLQNKCPSKDSCGNIWSLGKLPQTAGASSSLQVCARYQDDCCFDSWNIHVAKCSVGGENFFVYYLHRPVLCLSYCSDQKSDQCMYDNGRCHSNAECSNVNNTAECTCKNGFSGDGILCTDKNECIMGTHNCDANANCINTEGSFTCVCKKGYNGNGLSCSGDFPRLLQSPVIKEIEANDKLVALRCRFSRNSTSLIEHFNVTWFITGNYLSSSTVSGSSRVLETDITLHEIRKYGVRFGAHLTCSVEGYYANSSNSKSPLYTSKPFLLGILVQGMTPFVISEKNRSPIEVSVKLTIPLMCRDNKGCSIIFSIIPVKNFEHFTLSQCQLEFKESNASQVKTFLISANKNKVQDGNKIIPISIMAHRGNNIANEFTWFNYHLNLQVILEDVPFATCQSVGDPHLTTFDGLYYHHYQVGEYLFIENTCRNFQVHVRTFKCGPVSCNCGVAAREGDDVLIIDMCRDRVPRVSFPSQQKIRPNNSTKIKRDSTGRNFLIEFASGASIEFRAWPFAANIFLTIPSDDFGCTRGLCGTFDGDRNNEMADSNGINKQHELPLNLVAPSSFTESWKLATGTSLFYHKPIKVACNATKAEGQKCTCKSARESDPTIVTRDCHGSRADDVNEARFAGYREFAFPAAKYCDNNDAVQTNGEKIQLSEEDVLQEYEYNPTTIPIVVPTWPTAKGKTLNEVTIYCTNTIKNSQEGKLCTGLASLNFDTFIDQCIEDVKISDDFNFVMTSKHAMLSACKDELYTNTSHWEESATNNNKPQLPKQLALLSCPDSCSGNGRCINGTCECNPGFQSVDCSVNTTKGPEIKLIPNNGLCDHRTRRDCLSVRVIGSNFLNLRQLSCRVKEAQVSGSKEVIVNATLISFAEVRCDLKQWFKSERVRSPYVKLTISVSNDRIRFSENWLLYRVFDSKCIKCNNQTCNAKDSTCNISGECFEKCEPDPSFAGKKCIPSRNSSKFSPDLEGLCGNVSTTDMTNITCKNHHMQVDLDRRYFDLSIYQSITLRDPKCVAKISSKYITLETVPYLCGGVQRQTNDKIIYENTVIMKAKTESGMISRYYNHMISIQCMYDRDGFVTSIPMMPVTKVIGDEDGFGKFTFVMEMYKSKLYLSKFSSYPVYMTLDEELFFQITVSSQDNKLMVLIDNCYVTPFGSVDQSRKHFLINERCEQDRTTRFHPANRKHQRFSFKAFRFLGNVTAMVVHCYAFLCHKNTADERCTLGCNGNNINRARRDVTEGKAKAYSKDYLIESGPVIFQRKSSKNNAKTGDDSKSSHLTVIIVLVAGIGILILIVVALVKKASLMKLQIQKQNENIGIDNDAYSTTAKDNDVINTVPKIVEEEV